MDLHPEVERTAEAIATMETRGAAASLPNAPRYVLRGMAGDTVPALRASVLGCAETFRHDLDRAQDRLGRIGAGRLRDGDVVMTHCHSTDPLACTEAAVEQDKHIEETRPRNQGHITAKQLREMGVPVTLVVDNAAHR